MPAGATLNLPALSFLPSSVSSAITGPLGAVTAGLGSVVGSIPQIPQYFFTVPFANNQAVLYKLSIIYGQGPGLAGSPLGPGLPGTSIPDFIFPLTPNGVQKQSISLTNYYDVQGPANVINNGVQRIIDIYGLTPPIITISGTTGFQFHSLDQYQWSGKASFANLVQYIQNYIQLAVAATTSSQATNIPQLQFTDGYTGEVFNIVPLNQQLYSQDANRPIYQTYNLQFLASKTPLQNPIGLSQQDLLIQTFILARALLNAALLSWWNSILNGVLPGTIV